MSLWFMDFIQEIRQSVHRRCTWVRDALSILEVLAGVERWEPGALTPGAGQAFLKTILLFNPYLTAKYIPDMTKKTYLEA